MVVGTAVVVVMVVVEAGEALGFELEHVDKLRLAEAKATMAAVTGQCSFGRTVRGVISGIAGSPVDSPRCQGAIQGCPRARGETTRRSRHSHERSSTEDHSTAFESVFQGPPVPAGRTNLDERHLGGDANWHHHLPSLQLP